ncbi:MAG TPA: ABC transporter permease [Anaerolineales bacterium]|nr:ABC transporter permease [Anaerolineales bacterium]
MNNIYLTLSVTWKEIQLLLRDRGTLALLFLLPMLIAGMMGGGNLASVAGEESTILLSIYMVNQDSADFGREVTKAIQEIPQLEVLELSSPSEAEGQIAKGKAAAAVIIPADFSQKISNHEPTQIEVIVDPAQPESASIITGIMNQVVTEVTIWGEVQYGVRSILEKSGILAAASPQEQRAIAAQSLGVIMTRLNEIRENPAIIVENINIQGEEAGSWLTLYFPFLFSGITVMFAFFIVGTMASTLLGERETGTLRRLLAAPIPRGAILAGKILAYMLLVCIQIAVLLTFSHLAFNVIMGNSPLGLALLTLGVAFVATSLGMLVAALSKTPEQAGNTGTILAFVLGGLGGSIPLGSATLASRAGGLRQVLAAILPNGYAVEGYYRLMAENGDVVRILPQLGVLLGMGVLFFLIAVWRFKFEA